MITSKLCEYLPPDGKTQLVVRREERFLLINMSRGHVELLRTVLADATDDNLFLETIRRMSVELHGAALRELMNNNGL